MQKDEYDLIVIGAGPVGENVADRAVQGGLSAVIVESELVGGECSYWACMPSKTLLRPAAALQAARAVPGAAAAVRGGVDVAAALRSRDRIVHEWSDDGQVEWLAGAGIDLVRGHARLDGERAVRVTAPDGSERVLRARHAVAVCTGSAALMPEIPGLADAAPWTSREATAVQEVPASLAILGGGVVACELATAYASFGTQVTVIARSSLLGAVEPFASDAVTTALREAGVDVRLRTAATAVRREGGEVVVTLGGGGGDSEELRAAELLVATGRVPRTEDLGLETVGLRAGAWLDVDDTLRVRGSEWLYAVGDVNHRALLTHQGKYQARAAGDVIAARARTGEKPGAADERPWGAHVATADHRAVPQVVFTSPQVASVGPTLAQAEAAGVRVRALDVDLAQIAGAATYAEGYAGTARALVDLDRGVIVGGTLVGPDVAEMLHALTIAVVGEVPLEQLWHAVPAYPTVSELWLRWLEAFGRPQ
ncbi:MAG: NAD(P)/FAD-dependent oxidoreductase [Microbacterium sp.]|uniref:dihydrolipoyl dehydrogenase family protein n=1 Tax=Microbacterium sp. TaxID=51671 RepID=UPI001ACB05F7|nr:NAD(P)/FAD-dependent oxidoreductase [Microbacterium sp.]MBN9177923.1 NAD(P)/FAD-dependent oxidoreductase [Microbacterium sp.]